MTPTVDSSENSAIADFEASVDAVTDELVNAPDSAESTETAEETADPVDTDPVEQPEAELPEVESPEEEAEVEQPEQAEQEPVDDGIKERLKANGNKEYVVRQAQFERFRQHEQAVKQFQEVFGEPPTPELLQDAASARLAQVAMMTDFMSGDPQAHENFLGEFQRIANEAVQRGEVAQDPMTALAERFPDFLSQHNPEAHGRLSEKVVRSTLDDLYDAAQQSGDANLWRAIQNIDNKIFKKYRPEASMTARPDPVDQRLQTVMQREQRLTQKEQQESAARWTSRLKGAQTQNLQAASEAIAATLQPVEAAYQKFPEAFDGIKTKMNSLVENAIKQDTNWVAYQEKLVQQMRTTTSEQKRDAIQAQIVSRHRTKVQSILDPSVNETVRKILNQNAQAVKQQSDLKHQRSQNAAQRREPGTGAPAKTSLLPTPPKGLTSAQEIAWEIDHMQI
jgi:hypothetical protein